MVALGVDTSNYATSLAVVDTTAGEVVYEVKKFSPVPQGQGGLRQSDTLFHHTAILPGLAESLRQNGALQRGVKAVGVSAKPRPQESSYMPCFLAGVSFASALAVALDAPLVRTSHQQGHLAAALFAAGQPTLAQKELLFFHLSGGTTELLLTEGYAVKEKLGKSLDLYAGQAVDRLGIKLGLPFPSGEAISALAERCEEDIRPKTSLKGMDCHLSGLQNQCEKLLADGKDASYVAKYCLLVIAGTVSGMAHAARRAFPKRPILCAGGVMASATIRRYVESNLQDVYFVPGKYSQDNAIGVALIAAEEVPLHG